MSTTAPLPRRGIYAPMVVVSAGCLITLIAFGIRSTTGLFFTPMLETYSWDPSVFGLAFAVQNLMWGAMQPFAGMLADKFSSMIVVIIGAVIYASGTFIMGMADSLPMVFLGAGVLMGLGIAMTSFSLIMSVLGRILPPEKRSWAFGLATAASSLGQFVFAPLGYSFIAAFGWQSALYILSAIALFMIALAIPLGASKGGAAPDTVEADISLSAALKHAFSHSSYILLIFGFFVCGFHIAFITVYFPTFLSLNGVGNAVAAWSLGIIGLFNIIGSYLSGIYGGKYSKRYGLSFIYAARSCLILAFILLPVSNITAIIFSATMGLLWLSTVPLTMGLVMVMFGTRYMATLYGFVFFSHQIGSSIGIWLGSIFYKNYGNFDAIWYLGIALGIFAAIVHWPISENRAKSFKVQPTA